VFCGELPHTKGLRLRCIPCCVSVAAAASPEAVLGIAKSWHHHHRVVVSLSRHASIAGPTSSKRRTASRRAELTMLTRQPLAIGFSASQALRSFPCRAYQHTQNAARSSFISGAGRLAELAHLRWAAAV
jgi:hypothetical protein